jgi:2-hydroxychromene-2-carboxylate isomerase
MTDGKAIPVIGEFVFDFGRPNAHHRHEVMPAIDARARFAGLPILFGGLFKLANNGTPGEAFANHPNKLADAVAG